MPDEMSERLTAAIEALEKAKRIVMEAIEKIEKGEPRVTTEDGNHA